MALNAYSTTFRNALADQMGLRIDSGAGPGLLEIWTAAFATKLATLTFSDPSYGAAAAGVAQENAITDDTAADATGTAAVFRITSSTPTTEVEGTVGTSGADINFNSVAFVVNDNVSCSDLPVTAPS